MPLSFYYTHEGFEWFILDSAFPLLLLLPLSTLNNVLDCGTDLFSVFFLSVIFVLIFFFYYFFIYSIFIFIFFSSYTCLSSLSPSTFFFFSILFTPSSFSLPLLYLLFHFSSPSPSRPLERTFSSCPCFLARITTATPGARRKIFWGPQPLCSSLRTGRMYTRGPNLNNLPYTYILTYPN